MTILLVILLIGYMTALFVNELSLINSAEAHFAFQIEFYRYGLVLLSVLILIVAVADDFASGQFENLLSMPLSRWQYIVAQLGAVALMNLMIVIMASLVLLIQSDFQLVLVWLISMWMELMLCSLLALLAILSLEKVPSAMMLLFSLYVLSRASPIIIEIIEQSIYYSEGDALNQMILTLFQGVSFVLPNPVIFVQNNLFYTLNIEQVDLIQQALWLLIYGGFIIVVSLFDFYRKEFALNRG